MKWFNSNTLDLQNWEASEAHKMSLGVLTIGTFDGVHLGHRELIASAHKKALSYSAHLVVFTFYPHPKKTTLGDKAITNLFDQQDQQRQLELASVDYVYQQNFDQKFSQLTAEQFLEEVILKLFKPKAIVVGYDFRYGKNRSGDFNLLKSYMANKNVEVVQVEPLKMNSQIISSTLIRESLKQGQIKKANLLLGRSYYVSGIVEHGQKRGRAIGFPTVNINSEFLQLLQMGVYATVLEYKNKKYKSVTNIGINPTVSDEKILKCETHIFDFDEQIYGENVNIYFIEFIRPEMKFNGLNELKEQIHNDVTKAKDFLSEVVLY